MIGVPPPVRPHTPAPAAPFALGWIATSVAGGAAAVAFATANAALTPGNVAAAAAIEGALLATGQSALLRPYIGRNAALAWALGTVCGMVIARVLEFFSDLAAAPFVDQWSLPLQLCGGVGLGFFIGACMGVPQMLAATFDGRRLWLWPLVRGLAWAIALPLLLLVLAVLPATVTQHAFAAALVGAGAALSLVAGAIEAVAMTVLLQQMRGNNSPSGSASNRRPKPVSTTTA